MKQFAKMVLLAQAASDAGKGYLSAKPDSNAKKALESGYMLKDKYIRQALALSKGNDNIKVGYSSDINMSVILFDIKGFGQISFHSFGKFSFKWDSSVEWNGILGGSLKTSKKLARKFNLQHYNKG